jgi:hypothetical protein
VSVEVGEVDVVARPPDQNGGSAGAPAPAPPAGPALAAEIERSLALQESRDLRLHAD